jgi:hypothetical protein
MINLRETGSEEMRWMELVQDRIVSNGELWYYQWWSFGFYCQRISWLVSYTPSVTLRDFLI